MIPSSSHPLRIAFDCPHHADVCKTSAENVRKCLLYLLVARFGIFIHESLGVHDHGVQAKTALCRLLVDESLLNRVGMLRRSQTFQRSDFGTGNGFYRCDTRTDRLPFYTDRAGPALSQPTAEFRPSQFEIVAQRIKQRG